MKRFFRVQLRTLDVERANTFYKAVLGHEPPKAVRLHEQAIARGAPPHWLGFIDVGDVDRALASFLERGAVSLAPKWTNPEGVEAAVIRDPGGAVIALAKPAAESNANERSAFPEVVFRSLNTSDVGRAIENYRDLLGWEFAPPVELGALGAITPFAYEAGGSPVGSFMDIAGRPGVHPHWLHHFAVDDVDAAVARVRAAGGIAFDPILAPSGARIAVCDDDQGAAFALQASR